MKKEVHYNNGTKYNFITTIGQKLGQSLVSLNEIVFGVIESKPYKLEWPEIFQEYLNYRKEHGEVDIDIFAYDYVLGYSLVHKFSKDQALKEAMYLHLRAELLAKKAVGEIK